jgi:hypothetical protein
MQVINLLDAFASYNVKLVKRGRSAITSDGNLVISCWYAGFKKVSGEILRYEEDLTGQTTGVATALRAHLTEALTKESEVRAIVASGSVPMKAEPTGIVEPATAPATRTTYYARKDLVGRVTTFDGERFVVEFRRIQAPVQETLSKGALKRRAG